MFSEAASYHNGPLDPVLGREAIRATLAELTSMGADVSVDMTHLLADEHIVITERIGLSLPEPVICDAIGD